MTTADIRETIGIYLNDHLAGATGGVELARRVAQTRRGSPDGEQFRRLADDIAADRAALLSIMRSLEIPVRWYKPLAGWAAEKAGRLKFNGHLLSRSPLSDLVELEGMLLGVQGKATGWRTLLAVHGQELDAGRLTDLLARAEAQAALLEEFRAATARQLFGRSGSTVSASAASGTQA